LIDPVDALLLDLLEWLTPGPRPYKEVIDAWRTSCPRFPVWETAHDRGLLKRSYAPGRGAFVVLTDRGRDFLQQHRRVAARTDD
jgi:hypothetical protein